MYYLHVLPLKLKHIFDGMTMQLLEESLHSVVLHVEQPDGGLL